MVSVKMPSINTMRAHLRLLAFWTKHQPVDRGVYVSLYGIEAIHIGWETGAPNEDKLVNPETITRMT